MIPSKFKKIAVKASSEITMAPVSDSSKVKKHEYTECHLRLAKALNLFDRHYFIESYEILTEIKEDELLNESFLQCFISVMVILDLKLEMLEFTILLSRTIPSHYVIHLLLSIFIEILFCKLTYFATGFYKVMINDFSSAVDKFFNSIDLKKNFSPACLALGCCADRSNMSSQAIDEFLKAADSSQG